MLACAVFVCLALARVHCSRLVTALSVWARTQVWGDLIAW